ncbi:hypothetical protein ACF0H5_002198 [Mactra antiquata]
MKCRPAKFKRPICIYKIIFITGLLVLGIAISFLKVGILSQGNRFSSTYLDVSEWFTDRTIYCEGNYVGYAHRYFQLKSTVYDPSRDIFSVQCNNWMYFNSPKWYWFHTEFYAQGKYTQSLSFVSKPETKHPMDIEEVVFIVSRDYPHNFYHAMTQWYNLFILSKSHGIDMKNMTVLLLDRGPKVHLDDQWKLLFRQILKAGDLTQPLLIKNAIFSIAGHESPLFYFNIDRLPFIEEFSSKFLDVFSLRSKNSVNCDKLSITLVFRRDYYMHPEKNEEIRIAERKFKNEDEIISILESEFPGHTLNILKAENMSLPEQLKMTSNTDVLIAMHGCVLTQILFLPKHAMVLEMYPNFWTIQRFFSSIAKWRNVKHQIWQNTNEDNEFPNHYTYVPPSVIKNFALDVRKHFACHDTASKQLKLTYT